MRGPIVLAMTLLVVVACTTSYPPCYRGEYSGCTCAGAVTGYAACKITEDGFGPCVCDGTTPGLDGGRDAGDASDASDAADASDLGAPFLAPCGPNGACAGADAVCGSFPSKGGMICTKHCMLATDCPPPSPGCNPMGLCKAP